MNKKIMAFLLLIIGIVFVFSVQQLSGMKFNDKVRLGEIISGIKCLEVKGNIPVYITSEKRINNDRLYDIDYKDISIKRLNDTLKVVYKGRGNKSLNNPIESALSLLGTGIKEIKASGGAQIRSFCIYADSTSIIAEDSSKILWYAFNQFKHLSLNLSGSSSVYVSFYDTYKEIDKVVKGENYLTPTTEINLKDKAHLSVSFPKSKVIGNLWNKSYLEISDAIDNGFDCKEVSVKDSSAVIYIKSIFSKKR